MKISMTTFSVLLLASCLAVTAPAFAKRGADDPANHNAGDDKGGTVTSPTTTDDKGGQASGPTATDDKGGLATGPTATDDKGGLTGKSGDDHGGSHSGGQDDSSSNSRTALAIADSSDADTTTFKGKFRHLIKGNKEELRVDVKLKDPEVLADSAAAEAATVTASFTDTTGTLECELDFDDFERKKAEYHLRLKDRNGVLSEKDGSCGDQMPSTASGTVVEIKLEVTGAEPRVVGSLTLP